MVEAGGALYLSLKVLHIFGVVVFLGGLLQAVYWKMTADRTADPAYVTGVHRRIRRLDAQWIGPGALVTFAAGYIMVRGFGRRIASTPFALWGLILMFIALGLWYFGMRRNGDLLVDEAQAAWDNREPLSKAYATRSVVWLGFAFAAVALVVLVAVFMIFRFPGP